jgi:hypothetical protein
MSSQEMDEHFFKILTPGSRVMHDAGPGTVTSQGKFQQLPVQFDATGRTVYCYPQSIFPLVPPAWKVLSDAFEHPPVPSEHAADCYALENGHMMGCTCGTGRKILQLAHHLAALND